MFAFLQSSSATAVLSESLHTTASKSYFNFRASYGVAGLNLRTPCSKSFLFLSTKGVSQMPFLWLHVAWRQSSDGLIRKFQVL